MHSVCYNYISAVTETLCLIPESCHCRALSYCLAYYINNILNISHIILELLYYYYYYHLFF